MTNLINRIVECVYHISSLDGYTLREAEEQTRETLETDPCAVLRFLQDAAADGDTEAAELLADLKTALKHAHNRKKEEENSMTTINYKWKILTLDYEAQLDEYKGAPVFTATAHDESGNKYRIRWDYEKPEWYINEEETPVNNDLSAFADWEHPAEVTEE